MIEGNTARSIQDIILHIPYGKELYDSSMNYVIIVGNTWYGYGSYDGYMNHEGTINDAIMNGESSETFRQGLLILFG